MKKLLLSLLLAGGVQNSLAMQGSDDEQDSLAMQKRASAARRTAFLKQLEQTYSEPLIITAVKETNLELVAQLITLGENVNSCDQSARTALMFAAQSGKCQIAKALVDAGADVNASGIGLLTPLMYAASNGHVDVVDMLMASRKLNINAQDQRNQTALMLARDNGHADVAERLFQAGARNEKVFVQFADGFKHSLELARLSALNSSVLNSFLDNDSIQNDTTESAPIELHIFANLQDFSEFEALLTCPLKGNIEPIVNFLKKAHFLEINIVNMLKDLTNKDCYKSYRICKCLLLENPVFVTDLQNAFPEILIVAFDVFNDFAFAKLLIETGIDVNTVDKKSGRGVISKAIENHDRNIKKEDIEFLKLLIAARADVNAKIFDSYQHEHMSLLHWAMSYGHRDIVLLCIQAGANLNNIDGDQLNNDGLNTLMYACKNGDTEILGLLIAARTDVNAIYKCRDEEESDTALVFAAYRERNKEIVRLLIEAGANVDAKNYHGCTALIIAAQNGHTEIAKLLITAGADVNAKNNEGRTTLSFAAEKGHTEIARLLIDSGANFNIKATDGCTALIIAAQNGHTEIAKLLITARANFNIKAADGCTALIKATQNGHTEIAKLLITAGADVNAKNNEGRTTLSFAAERGHTEIARLLIEAGADVDIRAADGCTALNYAARNGQKEIARLLVSANAYVGAQDDLILVKLLTQ